MVLVDLENQRSAVQSDLNCILDPMAHLPVEISSDIFIRCLPSPPSFNPLQAPTIFLSVCRLWSNIALSTPSLWAAIGDGDVPVANFQKFFDLWLSRARGFPLSLALETSLIDKRAPTPVVGAVQTMVKQQAHRVQKLELNLYWGGELKQIIAPFTSLKSLTIGATGTNPTFSLNAGECLEILRAAPSLVECTFLRIKYDGDIHSHRVTPEPFVHLSLQHLRLGRRDLGHLPSSTVILQYLTLPALHTLHISYFDITLTDLISFLTRSSPPLGSLNVVESKAQIVESYLRYVPSVTDLGIGSQWSDPLPLLDLFRSNQVFLPNLRNLTIHGYHIRSSDYDDALNIINPRRSSLQSFRLIARTEGGKKVPTDTAIALGQLSKEGMKIHIGTKTQNYLST
ncbi:hypothetical protein B0H11DRAFT_2050925 [Mycena galericulata]|nr:hypothetical protein B0H11DRAFT_2050925 [Mycena galericulata]